MNRIISLLLVIVLMVGLFSGCGTAAPVETTQSVPVETSAPTEASTEPTLSPEELFLQSLPETLRQACELGIVDPTLLEDLSRPCTITEAAGMLQCIVTQKYGRESWIFANCVSDENAAQDVTRGWFITMMYAGEAETLEALKSDDYETNLKQLTDTTGVLYSFLADTLLRNVGYVYLKNSINPFGLINNTMSPDALIPTYGSYGSYGGVHTYVADLADFDGDIAALSYALIHYDRKTGQRLMSLDEEAKLRFKDPMTVGEVVETGLRYYNSLEGPQVAVAWEDVGTFDTAIITPELLSKQTDLPDASCEKLPSQWKGIRMNDAGYSIQQQDYDIYEYEIQAIKDAGFNMIHLPYRFDTLNGPVWTEGTLNETRLKKLDQIIAWCMERDIHLNLCCLHSDGWPDAFSWTQLFSDIKNADSLIGAWGAIARRYAEIPNKYLSFTLFTKPEVKNDTDYGTFFTPVVEAIRKESPDRCIIADIGYVGTGEAIAQTGVALSSPCSWPEELLFEYGEMSSAESKMQGYTWPLNGGNGAIDANAALAKAWAYGKSPDEVAAVAKKNGVGYMVSDWGPTVTWNSQIYMEDRMPDDVMQAYLTDMRQTMESRGWPGCYTSWYGFAGIAAEFPLVQSTTYTQMEGTPLLIDDEMMAMFQQMNGK